MTEEDQEKAQSRQSKPDPAGTTPADCSCIQDPFAALPPEMRPKPKSEMGGLRKVKCPGCGRQYWTNRETDLCFECENKGVIATQEKSQSGG